MKQAVRRKHHYIYKITRDDGRYYIGIHSTDVLEDGYFGSGSLLAKSIKKHGKEKHSKEILEFLPSRELLKLREKEIVNEEVLGDKLCMNLQLGGEGGWTSVASKAGHAAQRKLMENPEYREKRLAQQREAIKIAKRVSTEKYPNGTFKNKSHSKETRVIMSLSHQGKHLGSKNSQFGTCWMSKDGKSIKVKREQIQEYLSNGYLTGRNK